MRCLDTQRFITEPFGFLLDTFSPWAVERRSGIAPSRLQHRPSGPLLGTPVSRRDQPVPS